jgi:RNA recognition motif-containing protein
VLNSENSGPSRVYKAYAFQWLPIEANRPPRAISTIPDREKPSFIPLSDFSHILLYELCFKGRRHGRRPKKTRPLSNELLRAPPLMENIDSRTTLFVCNFPYSMTEFEVLALFPHRDRISRRVFPRFPGEERLRGFAFISYPTWELCQETINLLHMTECRGRRLIVRAADARQLDGRHRRHFEQSLPPPLPRLSERCLDCDRGFDDRDLPAGFDVRELIATLIARKLQRPEPRRPVGPDLSHLSREELIALLDQSRRGSPKGYEARSSPRAPPILLGIPKRDPGAVYFEDEE